VLFGEGGHAVDGVDRRDRVAEAEVGLALFHAAHVRHAGAGRLLHGEPRDGLFPEVLELAAQRNPGTALRSGHEFQIRRGSRSGKGGETARERKRLDIAFHEFPPQ
jgi:hypothetical protein